MTSLLCLNIFSTISSPFLFKKYISDIFLTSVIFKIHALFKIKQQIHQFSAFFHNFMPFQDAFNTPNIQILPDIKQAKIAFNTEFCCKA